MSSLNRFRAWLARKIVPRRPQAPFGDPTAIMAFIEGVMAIPAPRVIELGTRRSDPAVSTLHKVWVPHAAEYLGVDYETGLDVDVVADAHRLSQAFGPESVDAVVSSSTFEHIKYPWIAALEIARVLRPGGYVFVQTHQTFCLHAYPDDFWRFTEGSLRALFGTGAGLEILACHYEYPVHIVSQDDPGQQLDPAWLNVCLTARKVAPTPAAFRPDLPESGPSQLQ